MAIKANIVVDQGVDYSTDINLTDDDEQAIDLTGYTANSQIRKTFTSSNSVSFSTSVSGTTGVVTLSLTANQTGSLTSGRYVYDVFLTNGSGVKSRIVEGIVTVTPRVTR